MATLQEKLLRVQSELKRRDDEHSLEMQQERSVLRRTSAELQVCCAFPLHVFTCIST